ncbi:MAG TPA: bacillithiol system redox-active protein YtxJ [Bacteroidia bacterium]|jgi:bacillithiol system protein YtxJ|nr:bacillithiol system redox-active protein YtxJ [Bacteroidia bacterium]
MEFNTLKIMNQLDEIDEKSKSKIQVLFKHSTRCSISSMAKRVLSGEMEHMDGQRADVYYLDLLLHRFLSDAIAERYQVEHASPQLLVIKDGKCIYHASHEDISLEKALRKILGAGY